MKKNFYELLGVATTASPEEIKKAFRQLALKYHPDIHKNKKIAEELFKAISIAYKTLSDAESRFSYDSTLAPASSSIEDTQPGSKTPPSKKRRVPQTHVAASSGRNLIYHLNISLEEAVRGCNKTISYVRTHHGKRVTASIAVPIPKSVNNGQKLRLRGAGESENSKQIAGDLIIHVHYIDHSFYSISEFDVILHVPISIAQWLLKEKVIVPTLYGKKEIRIPEADEFGHCVVELPGLGLPIKNDINIKKDQRRTGDMFVKMKVQSPPPLEASLRAEVTKLSKLLPKSKEEIIFEEFLKNSL